MQWLTGTKEAEEYSILRPKSYLAYIIVLERLSKLILWYNYLSLSVTYPKTMAA